MRLLIAAAHYGTPGSCCTRSGAARIYRRCRQAGITPRGLAGCMIAAVAWRHHATLLTCDVHLDRVARVTGIELDKPATPERPPAWAVGPLPVRDS